MSKPSDQIANEAKNCSFTLQSIKKLLSLMGTQQPEYSDISYKANGLFALTSQSHLAQTVRFISPVNPRNPVAEIQKDCLEQDLVSLGKVFLQLDCIGTKFDYLTSCNSEIAQSEQTTILETHQLNSSTFLSKIICSLLSKNSIDKRQNVRSILLLLLQRQAESLKISLFSIVSKSHLDSLCLPIPSKRTRLDDLVWQICRQNKLHNITSQFDENGQTKTDLTIDLIKSALKVMLEWEEFRGQYDVLGVGVDGVIFGVENFKQKRKSALKLSLCINKPEIIREIGLMRICQAPSIIKFYQHIFFKDANGKEFVVYELERCKYSLIHHLELQRIAGEYSEEQKNSLIFQILDSVSFLHENRILHRNLKIDNFLITEDRSGQVVIKLGNFCHAVQLQNNFENNSNLEQQLLKREYQSPVNCILKRCNKESPLYFAPERWETPDLSTYLTDSFSIGLCVLFLDNWLVCSEEQLAQKLLSSSLGSLKFCLNLGLQIHTKNEIKRITQQLLMFQPEQRISILGLTEKCAVFWGKQGNFFGLN